MNKPAEVEMTIEQWVRSRWFIATARMMAIIGGVAVTGGGAFITWAVLDTKASATMAIEAVAEIRTVQDQRAALADVRNQLERRDREQLTAEVRQLSNTVLAQQGDIGEIKGLVRQLARQDVARRMVPSYGPPTVE